jgi:hypothetical protein
LTNSFLSFFNALCRSAGYVHTYVCAHRRSIFFEEKKLGGGKREEMGKVQEAGQTWTKMHLADIHSRKPAVPVIANSLVAIDDISRANRPGLPDGLFSYQKCQFR